MTGVTSLDWSPTAPQLELIQDPGSRFVEACPGSGKTRAIVARFERLATGPRRRGVGLVSFTNAAVDEVTSRCADPQSLDPPNYVGTFDGFINRFITGPYLASELGQYPRFIDSWASIPGARFRLTSMANGAYFQLDHFDWDDQGNFRFDERRAAGQWSGVLRSAYNDAPTFIDQRADGLRRSLVRDRHLVSSSASRRIALRLLADASKRATWIALLAGRFDEMIVDEAQDCGVEELAVLDAMVEGGITVVAVADLDQAIFEFRRADPKSVREFAERLGYGTPLDGNFRSSPAICAIGDSLGSSPRSDVPLGPNRDHAAPVRLVAFQQPGDLAATISEILAEEQIDALDCRVLAHRRTDAATCAGAVSTNTTSGRAILRFASAHLTLGSDTDSTRRRRAIDQAERVLLNLAECADVDLHSNESLAQQLGVSSRWVRDATTRVVFGVDPALGRNAYTAEVRRIVSGLSWPASVTLPNLGQRLATPSAGDWATLALDPPEGLPWSTIHSAKGREFDAVALVIPKQLIADEAGMTALDLWEAGQDGESRRVLYVGATRARKLLIAAVHTDHSGRVATLLGL